MYIDLSFLKEIGNRKKIVKEFNISNLDYADQDIETTDKFVLNIDIYNTGDSFIINGTLKGSIILKCSRCLEKFPYPLNITLNEELLKIEILDISRVKIDKYLYENILISIPIKSLCSKHCKGLCPICGQNLNYGQCDCKSVNIDPRLEKLKYFLKKSN
jgi:uncharacterized protein